MTGAEGPAKSEFARWSRRFGGRVSVSGEGTVDDQLYWEEKQASPTPLRVIRTL